MDWKTPLWLRIAFAVLLAVVFVAVIYIGAGMILGVQESAAV